MGHFVIIYPLRLQTPLMAGYVCQLHTTMRSSFHGDLYVSSYDNNYRLAVTEILLGRFRDDATVP